MKAEILVSAVQQPCNDNSKTNLDNLCAQIRQAADKKADLIVLPELHNTPYFCQSENTANFKLAETIPGPTTEFFSKLASRLKIIIVSSIFEKRAPGIYHNTAVVLDKDGGIAGKYRKMHIPDDPGFYEKFYFTPGDLGFKPINTSIGKLGVLICWDQWYPEAARLMTLAGAELLIFPSAIGWDPADSPAEKKRQLQAWMTIQRAHAVANGLPVISCNRTGFEQSPIDTTGIEFWGNSFIAGAQGEVMTAAADCDTKLLTCSIDISRTEKIRQIWPFLRDRRTDAYSGLQKRYID